MTDRAGRAAAPLLDAAVAELLSPESPGGLDELVAALPRRPRFLGPEAWLRALGERAEEREDRIPPDAPRHSIARNGEPGIYSRRGGGAVPPVPGPKEKSW